MKPRTMKNFYFYTALVCLFSSTQVFGQIYTADRTHTKAETQFLQKLKANQHPTSARKNTKVLSKGDDGCKTLEELHPSFRKYLDPAYSQKRLLKKVVITSETQDPSLKAREQLLARFKKG